MPRDRKWSLPLRYSNGNITWISHFSQECYMYVHFIFLQLITSNITRTAQTKKLIVECILLDYELYSEESIASIFMVNDFYRIFSIFVYTTFNLKMKAILCFETSKIIYKSIRHNSKHNRHFFHHCRNLKYQTENLASTQSFDTNISYVKIHEK